MNSKKLTITAWILLIILIFIRCDLIHKINLVGLQTFYKRLTYKPMVSVLISSYNMANYLPRSIASIQAQTYENWELLVINDGSLDNTKDVLRKYENDYKIRIVHNKENLGLIKSLNKGLKLAKGKYIARLDADDISLPNRLERQVEMMEDLDLDLSGAWCEEAGRYDSTLEDNYSTISIGLSLLKSCIYCHSTTMFKKDFLKEHNLKYDLNYKNAEDYNLWLKIFLNGGSLGYLGGEPLSIYHRSWHSKEWFAEQNKNTRKIQYESLSTIVPNASKKLLFRPLPKLIPYLIIGNYKTKILNQRELIECAKNRCYERRYLNGRW